LPGYALQGLTGIGRNRTTPACTKEEAIGEAEKLALTNNQFYYLLLGNLYTDKAIINTYKIS
jgi:hypothetical protein